MLGLAGRWRRERNATSPHSYLTAQDRIRDRKKKKKRKTTKRATKSQLKSAAFMLLQPHHTRNWFQQLKWYSPLLFTKTQINSDTMLTMAMHPCISTSSVPMVAVWNSTRHLSSPPSLSPSFPKCWIYLPLAAIVMTPPIDPVAWKLVAGKVVVRD